MILLALNLECQNVEKELSITGMQRTFIQMATQDAELQCTFLIDTTPHSSHTACLHLHTQLHV